MKKQSKEWERGWTQLCLKYREWEDMRAKGKIKMKKKTNKDGKEYYDFDFSRYQYYYSYPDDHIGLASPTVQRDFINHILEKSCDNFTPLYLDRPPSNWHEIQNILKPLELHQFLRDMNEQLTHKITSLRIQKTLRIKKMKGLFGNQNQLQKSLIELIESQIRSLLHKQIRINQKFGQMGNSLSQRLKDHKSVLKTRIIDEFQFSDLTKNDIMVLMRIRQVKQALSFNTLILTQIINSCYHRSWSRIKSDALESRASKTFNKKKSSESQRLKLIDDLIQKSNEKQPTFFDSPDNKAKLQTMISSLNYIEQFQNNIQETKNTKFYSPHFTTIQLNYEEVMYVPLNLSQIKSRLVEKLKYYFNKKLVDDELLKSSDEHICYKVNNLCFLQLKVLWQTYNYGHQKQQSALIKIRSMMRKQLELVFSHNVNNLLNIRNHSIKISTNEKWIPKLLFNYTPQAEKQSIMAFEISQPHRFQDPMICSFIQLLGVNRDIVVREHIQKYVTKSVGASSKLYSYRSLYYKNCSGDEKIHLINVLNQNISIKKPEPDPVIKYFYQLIQKLQPSQKIDQNLLRSYYMVVFLRCSQTRYQLMQILNAQIMCMIKIQSRIRMLWKKGKIPFEMSKEFIDRFNDPIDSTSQGFNFVNSQTAESHVDKLFNEMYSEDADRDFVEWNAEIGIQVRRKKSDNPLLQGKSVIYSQTLQYLEECMTRIEFLCSECIKRRQTYLPDAQLTEIVDRLQLLFDHITLEHDLQKSKLKLLDIYNEQALSLTSPEGIRLIYDQMNKVINYNNVVDLTQPHFKQCYETQIETFEAKAKILSILVEKQRKFEKQHIKKSFNEFKLSNLMSSIPQLSSIYYTEQIAAQDHSIIEQAAEDQNQSVSDSESQLVGKNTISEISSVVDGGQYQLKTSFQQVLSKNSVQAIKQGNNKKQEIMNKKKQKIINDTILGALIPRTARVDEKDRTSDQFYCYSYLAVSVVKHIDQLLGNCYLYPNNRMKAIFMNELVDVVKDFTFQEYKPLIKPEQLTVCLNSAHKSLNKFVEKAKSQGSISSRSSNQQWLCISSKIMEGIISGESGEQIDEMRGLYVGLNAFHLNQLNFCVKQIQNIEKSPYSQFALFQKLVGQHSGHKIEPKQSLLQGFNFFEKRQLCFYKLKQLMKQNGENTYLCVGNYAQYMKAVTTYDIGAYNLMSSYNSMMQKMLHKLFTLQSQVAIMEKYQCCYKLFPLLQVVPNIENRVNLRKKLDFITSYKRTFLPKTIVSQLLDAIDSCGQEIPKFRKVQAKMSLNSMASLAYEFEKYITQIGKAGVMMNMLGQELKAQIRTQDEIALLKQISFLMPLIDKHLSIVQSQNVSMLNVFVEAKQLLEKKEKKDKRQVKLKIVEDKLSLKRAIDYVLGANDVVISWIKQNCEVRRKDEIKLDPKKLQFNQHMSRHFTLNHNQTRSKFQQSLAPYLKDNQKYTKTIMLRQWMQTQLLVFGCSLSAQQLIKYRKMLCNSSIVFPIFWEDNTKHIISNRELSRLKNSSLEAQQVVNHYKNQYLTYAHLKKVYRNFIQDLAEYQFEQECSDSFLVLYLGAPNYFKPPQHDWGFLTKFCDPFAQQPNTQLDQFCNFLKISIDHLGHSKNRLFYEITPQRNYNLDKLKYELWNSSAKQTVKRVDSARRFIKQRLNETKSIAIKPITDEIALPYYRMERLQQILTYLGVQISQHKLEQETFKQNFDKHIHEGLVILNPKENFIFNMTEKSIESKGQFIKSKDQIMKIIISCQFYIKLIREKFFGFNSNILENQLSLRKILQEDLYNQEVSRDQRILKQTINKILVPKVKLNSFLASPLKVQNYFFAGTVKISFIDQFLNKLRNRAVLIELAQGGTGYLLKVNELDQSVDLLCKSILGFSEKQFSDRFRTVLQSFEETKERNGKLTQENKNLKAILNAMKGYQSKQIKSLLYQKLNDYLVTFYEHDKSYTVLVNLLKSVENKIENQLNNKFCAMIKNLSQQNKQLKDALKKINAQNSQVIKSCTNQIRDILYSGFKNKAEDVLNKKFIQDVEQEAKFQNIQTQDSQVLIRKLKMQKSFYELKIAKIEGSYEQKIKSLEKKLLEQSKLQNLLLMQQQKNKGLTKQVKQLQKCSIQNQLLKKQMTKKQEEETMQKFRLVKVNESLKGKIKRIQDEMQTQKVNFNSKIDSLIKSQEKNKTHFSVQVNQSDNNKLKRKSFKIKTQSSSGSHIFDMTVWKQKWLKSQKRSQQLIEGVKKAYEHFSFTKNPNKLLQSLKVLLGNYENRKIELKGRSTSTFLNQPYKNQ